MDEQYFYQKQRPVKAPSSAMANASFLFGIIAIAATCCSGSLLPAGLGIIFAVLSRGERMEPKAKTGLWLSVISLVILAVMLGTVFYYLITSGLLDKYQDRFLNLDPSDTQAVQELENDLSEDITSDLFQRLEEQSGGAALFGGTSEAAGGSASEASGGTAGESAGESSLDGMLNDLWEEFGQTGSGQAL